MRLFKERIVLKQKTVYVEVEQRKRFADYVILITGASGSIGSAIAQRFAVEGATVVLTGRNLSKLQDVKNQISCSTQIDVCQMDVTDEASVSNAMKTISDKYGRIDMLINNAGFSARTVKQPLHLQTIDNIDNLLQTNLRGSILTSREVVQYMQNSKQGRIVNIASIVGLQGKDKHAEYAAAKAGVFGLMKSQAIGVGKYGITVNCVSPGLVPREDASEEKLARFEHMNRLNSICTPEDIANAVAFLCSAEARYVTGQNLCVDGGRSLGLYGD
ncbi:MAG: SDR family oxidoreductase [Tyzzerella sp.]|nr:SDR family oxidoreductase [Tyzzerella sp.]